MMKLDFCAVCGSTEDLQQHHIEPVIVTGIKRTKKKGYNPNKKLNNCTVSEVFAWVFDQGYISADETITLCNYHHNIMHGIAKSGKAEHSKLTKLGIEKAKAQGKTLGRRTVINDSVVNKVIKLRSAKKSYRAIASEIGVSRGTVGRIINSTGVADKITSI